MNRKSIMQVAGVEASTYEQTLKAAGLDWEPQMERVGGMDSGVEHPKFRLLTRSDTQAPLGIVGNNYKPSCPKEFLQGQFEFAEFTGGKVTRAGFLPDRSKAFAFVKLEDINIKPKGERKVGDICGVYIYSIDGWDGGTPRKSRLFIERLRCLNGMRSSEIRSSLWVSHSSGMEELYEKRWKTFLAEVKSAVVGVREQFQKLAETPMTREQMVEFALKLVPGEGAQREERRDQLVTLFAAGEGNRGATRWDAYNAVTEATTHHQQRRVNAGSSHLLESNLLLGVLEKDTTSPRALEILLEA